MYSVKNALIQRMRMVNKYNKIVFVLGILLFLGAFAILLVSKNQDKDYKKLIKEDRKKLEKIYDFQIKEKQKEIDQLTKTTDSLIKVTERQYLLLEKKNSEISRIYKTELIKINKRYEKDIELVNSGSTDDNIEFLSKHLQSPKP